MLYDNIGTNLKRLRRAKKMTFTEVWESTGISTRKLSNIERNITTPKLKDLYVLAEFYNVNINNLLIID